MSKELETVALWRDGGGGLWMGRSGLERPWNWLTGTDASPDDLLLGESRKAEGPFEKVSPDDVRPSADLPDRDPRNDLTDTWRVVPGDRLVTFKPDALPESRRISAVRRNAADLSLVVNDPVTGEPVEPDLMGPSEGRLLRLRQEPRDAGMAGLLEVGARHGGLPRCIGVRPQMNAGARSGHGVGVARQVRVVVRCARRQLGETRRAGMPGRMKPTHGKGDAS